MAIGFLHCLQVFQWIKLKQLVFMFEKVVDVRALESHLLNFSPGCVKDISLIQSCRELNDVSFEILGCLESSCNCSQNATLKHLVSVILQRMHFY